MEEITKGLGVLALFWLLRAEFDNMRDGLVYGALVGVGFNLVETPLHVAQGLSLYGEAPWGLLGSVSQLACLTTRAPLGRSSGPLGQGAARASGASSCAHPRQDAPIGGWRRRADSNRRVTVLQTVALTTWLRRLFNYLQRFGRGIIPYRTIHRTIHRPLVRAALRVQILRRDHGERPITPGRQAFRRAGLSLLRQRHVGLLLRPLLAVDLLARRPGAQRVAPDALFHALPARADPRPDFEGDPPIPAMLGGPAPSPG